MKPDLNEILTVSASIIILGVIVGYFSWWLPQKWEVCTEHYHNKPAQIICMLDR